MASAIIHQFPGGTQEQYEASIGVVHPSRTSLPQGQIFHAAGAVDGGWRVFAVHDTKESWERFRDEILMPTFQAGVEGGFEAPPEETAYEFYTVLP